MPKGSIPQRSLILITVDCLRLDRTGDAAARSTPFLRQLAAESHVFPRAVVAGTPTYFSFPAILGGRHPLALGRDVLGLAPGEPTLASSFQQQGYVTAAFVAGNPYLSRQFGYAQGFEKYDNFEDCAGAAEADAEQPEDGSSLAGRLNAGVRGLAGALGLGRVYNDAYFSYGQWRAGRRETSMAALRRYPSADAVMDRVGPWIAGRAGEPFFLWLHLMDCHNPYYPPLEALAAVGRPDIDAKRARYLNSVWNRSDLSAGEVESHLRDNVALYDAGVYWVDQQIGRLLKLVEQFGLNEDTAVAVSADHGEEFLEHGRRYHRPEGLPETLIRVPLMLRVPGEAGRVLPDIPFSLRDLPATLLEASGCEAGAMPGKGRWVEMLDGTATSGPVITECIAGSTNPYFSARRDGDRLLAVSDGRYKLVWHLGEGRERLFDLVRDPGEVAPVPEGEECAARARLLQAALAHVRQSRAARNPVHRLRARLRDLRLEGAAAFR